MYEKRLKEISKKIGDNSKRKFYILTHKKHRREVYFQNNAKAIKFLKVKFNPTLKEYRTLKSVVYFLIKAGLLQPFLKKITLSSKLGDVIFVAGQIKSFDLKKRIVTSFTKYLKEEKNHILFKERQKKIGNLGFAPKIFKIDKKFPYSKEELLEEEFRGKDVDIFKTLLRYYSINKIKEITLKEYINFLRKINDKDENILIKNTLKQILLNYPKDIKLKMVAIHGSFAKEQVLIKDKLYVFTDWMTCERDLITRDLLNYFRKDKNLLNKKYFDAIIKIYPKDIGKNIKLYLMLDNLCLMIKNKKH